VRDVARLLTSELVTNTIVHAQTDIDLLVHVDSERVRVEVQDEDDHLPAPSHPSAEAMSGRGLQIVAGMATAWGVDPRERGKVVWFEVPAVATR